MLSTAPLRPHPMDMSDHDRKQIDDFLEAIRPFEAAYRNPVFSFVAFKGEQGYALIQAALILDPATEKSDLPQFSSNSVKAAHYFLVNFGLDCRGFIDALLSGSIQTPDGELLFLPNENGPSYSPFYLPFHQAGLEKQRRIGVLRIAGKSALRNTDPTGIDWELKAVETPFDGLQDLVLAYGLGELRYNQAFVEVVAHPAVKLDPASEVSGRRAHLKLSLAEGLDRQKARLGYRIENVKGIVARSSLDGSQLEWTKSGSVHTGSTEITISDGDRVHAISSYDGIAKHFTSFVDPNSIRNGRRAAFEAFDANLSNLKSLIGLTAEKVQSRHFESAVSWVLWMLGFSVAHLGNTEATEAAADLIAVTASGDIAVIECTIDVLKSDKISRLLSRTEIVRRNVVSAGNTQTRVLPVFATARERSELVGDLERVEKLGVAVFDKHDLARFIEQSRCVGESDLIFRDAEAAASFAMLKY